MSELPEISYKSKRRTFTIKPEEGWYDEDEDMIGSDEMGYMIWSLISATENPRPIHSLANALAMACEDTEPHLTEEEKRLYEAAEAVRDMWNQNDEDLARRVAEKRGELRD